MLARWSKRDKIGCSASTTRTDFQRGLENGHVDEWMWEEHVDSAKPRSGQPAGRSESCEKNKWWPPVTFCFSNKSVVTAVGNRRKEEKKKNAFEGVRIKHFALHSNFFLSLRRIDTTVSRLRILQEWNMKQTNKQTTWVFLEYYRSVLSLAAWGIGLASDDVTKHSNAWQRRKLVLNKDSVPYKSMLGEKSLAGRSSLFLRGEVWTGLTTPLQLSASHFKRCWGSDKCGAVFRSIDNLPACFCMGRCLCLEPILPVATPVAALWRSTCKPYRACKCYVIFA